MLMLSKALDRKHPLNVAYFNHKCEGIELPSSLLSDGKYKTKVYAASLETNERVTLCCDFVIGADGVHSAVRESIKQMDPEFEYSKNVIPHAYKTLHIPSTHIKSNKKRPIFLPTQDAIHTFPRGTHFLHALPRYDGSYVCTLVMPREVQGSFEEVVNRSQAEQFFKKHHSDVLDICPGLSG